MEQPVVTCSATRDSQTAEPQGEAEAKTPVGAMTLVAAAYSETVSIRLTFSRAIDVSGIDVTTFYVDDGNIGFRYSGFGEAVQFSPNSVEIQLEGVEELPFPDVTLAATASNGIVALGDGASWAGCVGVVIPFGE